MQDAPPSLRAIAERSGVHQSTVSRVLKNDARISSATAEKVRRAAKELGYVPDPQLSKLMAHMRGMREKRFEVVIAFLLPTEPYPDDFSRRLLKGALARASELGYVVDRFPSDLSPESMKRLDRVLRARGIEGLLLLPRVHICEPPGLDIRHLAVVSTTSFTAPFPVHEVLPDHVHNMELLRQALLRQRARRPGFVSWAGLNQRQRHAGPRMIYQYAYETLRQPPLPLFDWHEDESSAESRFCAWFQTHKPDALLIPSPVFLQALRRVFRAQRWKLPPCYSFTLPGPNLPGIDQQPDAIGSAAIDMLTSHMQRNEKGWPGVTKHMLIPGRWQESAPPGSPLM